jgi:hypothetical protein
MTTIYFAVRVVSGKDAIEGWGPRVFEKIIDIAYWEGIPSMKIVDLRTAKLCHAR